MKTKAASLMQIERWMQSVIIHGGGVAEGVDSPEARRHLDVARAELESVILPSKALGSAERLEIYVDAYHERLLECLREEFTATGCAMGDELFHALAFGYLQRYPSRTYTLNVLGAKFPQFLAETRLHAHAPPEGALATWADFVIELAAFERLLRDVFDGPGSEGGSLLDAWQLTRVPQQQWADTRLIPAPCLRLARFEHPVHEYWAALKRGEQPSVAEPGVTFLAVNRRDYAVGCHELSSVQFGLLGALIAGSTLGDAIRLADQLPGSDPHTFERGLGEWFSTWTREGFFLELVPGGSLGY